MQIKLRTHVLNKKELSFILSGKLLEFVDQMPHLGSNILSTEIDINMYSNSGVEWYWLFIDQREVWSTQ